MQFDYDHRFCSRCSSGISLSELDYSTKRFQLPLCLCCQIWYNSLPYKPSLFAKELFMQLRKLGYKACLEEFDGFKSVDIVIREAMVHIEVDGLQHTLNADIAINDLWRTYYSARDGYDTIRIPNAAINKDTETTTIIISRILAEKIKNYRHIKRTE